MGCTASTPLPDQFWGPRTNGKGLLYSVKYRHANRARAFVKQNLINSSRTKFDYRIKAFLRLTEALMLFLNPEEFHAIVKPTSRNEQTLAVFLRGGRLSRPRHRTPIRIHLNLQDLGLESAFTRLLQFLFPRPPQISLESVPTCKKTKLIRICEHPDLSPNTHGLNPIVVIE